MKRGLVAASLTATIATGCGGGSPDSSIQLRAEATRACTTATLELERLRTPSLGAADEAFLRRGIAVLEPELGRLRSIHARGEDRPVYTAALGVLAQEIVALDRAARALRHGQDPALAFAALQRRLRPLESQADDAWRALGVPACAAR